LAVVGIKLFGFFAGGEFTYVDMLDGQDATERVGEKTAANHHPKSVTRMDLQT
jgi:hypothetical protein